MLENYKRLTEDFRTKYLKKLDILLCDLWIVS